MHTPETPPDAPLDLRAVADRLEQGPAFIAHILGAHLPTHYQGRELIQCQCGLSFHYIDAKAWHRHAAAMVWNALQEDALLAALRAAVREMDEAERLLELRALDYSPREDVGVCHFCGASEPWPEYRARGDGADLPHTDNCPYAAWRERAAALLAGVTDDR